MDSFLSPKPALCNGRGEFLNLGNGDLPAGFGGAGIVLGSGRRHLCVCVLIYINIYKYGVYYYLYKEGICIYWGTRRCRNKAEV